MKHFLDKVRDGSQSGWLKVAKTDGGEIFIPYGIHTQKLASGPRGETFRILEGNYEDAIIYTPFIKEKISYFSTLKNKPAINTDLLLHMSKKQLEIDKKIFSVIFDSSLDEGEYSLLIPDYPHQSVSINLYSNESSGGSRFASTWFKFVKKEHSVLQSTSYLHFGTYSEGCITFPYIKSRNASDWSNLVLHLSRSRKKSGVSSTMKVVR